MHSDFASYKHERIHQMADGMIRDHKVHADLENKQRCMEEPIEWRFCNNEIYSTRFLKIKALLQILTIILFHILSFPPSSNRIFTPVLLAGLSITCWFCLLQLYCFDDHCQKWFECPIALKDKYSAGNTQMVY